MAPEFSLPMLEEASIGSSAPRSPEDSGREAPARATNGCMKQYNFSVNQSEFRENKLLLVKNSLCAKTALSLGYSA